MAYVVSERAMSLNTNKGPFVYTIYRLDSEITVDRSISIEGRPPIDPQHDPTPQPWCPLEFPRSVIFSKDAGTTVITPFESTGGAVKAVAYGNSSLNITLYNENNVAVRTDNLTSVNDNRCGSIECYFFEDVNGVPFVTQPIWEIYAYGGTTEADITLNTSDSFGFYKRPSWNAAGSFLIRQGNIDNARIILRDSTAPVPPTPSDPYGGEEATEGGGEGGHDDTTEPIDIPTVPTISSADSKFITIYNPSLSQLNSLANYMWSSSFDIALYKTLFANPMDCILGLSIVPVAVPNGGTSTVTVGNMPTTVSMNKAGSQYVDVSCGSVTISEYWGGYLDYEPYTKIELYLPYIGTHAISADDVMGKTVGITYRVDILSGACAAYIKCGDSVLYQFIGQCASSIPITGNDWTNVINGVLSIAGSIGSMVATGGASAPMAVAGVASTAVNALKPNIEKSGSMSGTGGLLGIQKPYFIVTRPRQAIPANQNSFIGYPSFVNVSLDALGGYNEIESVHLENIHCTGEELAEIERLLKEGVIFSGV